MHHTAYREHFLILLRPVEQGKGHHALVTKCHANWCSVCGPIELLSNIELPAQVYDRFVFLPLVVKITLNFEIQIESAFFDGRILWSDADICFALFGLDVLMNIASNLFDLLDGHLLLF